MSSDRQSFMEQLIKGEAPPEAMDDFIDLWHEGDDTRSLPEFLGMSEDEYGLWVEKPDALPVIFLARKRRLALPEVLSMNEQQFLDAASAPSGERASSIRGSRRRGSGREFHA